MVILITGASHTGKTVLAQRLLETYGYSYLSMDHLKMGLIRSGNTQLTPLSSHFDLTEYLWPIVRELIKTVIENSQNLIVEGCYIPANWQKDFSSDYLRQIRFICLILSEGYIRNNFPSIQRYANTVEQRKDDSGITVDSIIRDNAQVLRDCLEHALPYILIEDNYEKELAEGIKLWL